MLKKYLFVAFLIIISTGCGLRKEYEFSGQTMGTTYHIKIIAWSFSNTDELGGLIQERLDLINNSMSTYIPDSEISRFNALRKTDERFYVSDDFLNVVGVGTRIYEMTNGAWDGTVMPLMELWGFTKGYSDIYEMRTDVPDKKIIEEALENIGFDKIEIYEGGYLIKRLAALSVDFASIAKGYAVDQLAVLLRDKGFDDFLVEIGGEIYAAGKRMDGKAWRVGINTPKKDASYDQVYAIIDISGQAVATSGDYRNFFEVNGTYYSHILDPRTGYPVTNGVVSVTVLADTCVFADGLATGILVMGAEKGLELVSILDGVECLIVVQESEGKLINYYSKGFKLLK